MPKRKADAIRPPTDSASRPDDQPDQGQTDGTMGQAVQRREQAQTDQAAAAAWPCDAAERGDADSQSAIPTAASVAITPFSRLATVELQLVMRCCDQSTLIALARCNKFALAAASSPFVWQPLSPVELRCDCPLDLSERLRPERSLLRHADISVTWRLRTVEAAGAEQVAALVALPRLRGLAIESSHDDEGNSVYLSDEGAARLFDALTAQIDNGGALTNLSVYCQELHQAGGAPLTAFVERSRTLTTLKIACFGSSAANDTLAPLAAALAQCRTLTSLELGSQVYAQPAFRALFAVVQHSASLATFNIWGLRCDAESAVALAAAIKQSRSLTDLRLAACFIRDAGTETLAAAIEQSSSGIRRLVVSNNDIRSVGAASLARLLSSNRCALTALDVTGNCIKNEGALALAEGLQTNRTLTELCLCSNMIGTQGTAAVVSALRLNPHFRFRVLALSGNGIDPPAAAALAETMQRSGALERLEMSDCALTDEGMTALAVGIGHSHALQLLDLSHNRLGAASAAALAEAISACPALTSLDVCGTMIGDAGLAALAPALVNVRSLRLNECGLTRQSADSLAGLIRDSRALESLHADFNELGPRGVAVLAAALQPSSTLRTLHAQGCDAGADGVIAVADALRRGWRASDLRLGGDRAIDDSAALALAEALTECGSRCTLATLSLNDSGLTAAGALALVGAARGTSTLRCLDLNFNHAVTAADRPALVAACGPQPHFMLSLFLSRRASS